MERVIDLLREESIRCDCPVNVGRFQRNDDVSEIEIFENLQRQLSDS